MPQVLQVWLRLQDQRLIDYVERMKKKHSMSESEVLRTMLYATVDGDSFRDVLKEIRVDLAELKAMLGEVKQ